MASPISKCARQYAAGARSIIWTGTRPTTFDGCGKTCSRETAGNDEAWSEQVISFPSSADPLKGSAEALCAVGFASSGNQRGAGKNQALFLVFPSGW